MTSEVSSFALKGKPVNVPPDEVQLTAEIQELVNQLPQSGQYAEVLKTTQAEFAKRMKAAGFRQRNGVEFITEMKALSGRYLARAWTQWLHPDSKTPFFVGLTAEVQTVKVLRGKVMLSLKIFENRKDDNGPGVFVGSSFSHSIRLTDEGRFTTAKAWFDHVTGGLATLSEDLCAKLFDRGMAHIEAVTTP